MLIILILQVTTPCLIFENKECEKQSLKDNVQSTYAPAYHIPQVIVRDPNHTQRLIRLSRLWSLHGFIKLRTKSITWPNMSGKLVRCWSSQHRRFEWIQNGLCRSGIFRKISIMHHSWRNNLTYFPFSPVFNTTLSIKFISPELTLSFHSTTSLPFITSSSTTHPHSPHPASIPTPTPRWVTIFATKFNKRMK